MYSSPAPCSHTIVVPLLFCPYHVCPCFKMNSTRNKFRTERSLSKGQKHSKSGKSSHKSKTGSKKSSTVKDSTNQSPGLDQSAKNSFKSSFKQGYRGYKQSSGQIYPRTRLPQPDLRHKLQKQRYNQFPNRTHQPVSSLPSLITSSFSLPTSAIQPAQFLPVQHVQPGQSPSSQPMFPCSTQPPSGFSRPTLHSILYEGVVYCALPLNQFEPYSSEEMLGVLTLHTIPMARKPNLPHHLSKMGLQMADGLKIVVKGNVINGQFLGFSLHDVAVRLRVMLLQSPTPIPSLEYALAIIDFLRSMKNFLANQKILSNSTDPILYLICRSMANGKPPKVQTVKWNKFKGKGQIKCTDQSKGKTNGTGRAKGHGLGPIKAKGQGLGPPDLKPSTSSSAADEKELLKLRVLDKALTLLG